MGCRECPECGKPKACDDELCIMCELKEAAIDRAKYIMSKVIHKGEVRYDKGTG